MKKLERRLRIRDIDRNVEAKFQPNCKNSSLKFTLKDNKENKVDTEDEFVVPIPSEPKLSVSDFKLMKVLGQGTYGFKES